MSFPSFPNGLSHRFSITAFNSFEGCYVHVKFDNQPIVQYGAAEAADGRSDMIFIENYAGFVRRLRHAKKVTIEAEFYQSGWQQLEFSPTGLNW